MMSSGHERDGREYGRRGMPGQSSASNTGKTCDSLLLDGLINLDEVLRVRDVHVEGYRHPIPVCPTAPRARGVQRQSRNPERPRQRPPYRTSRTSTTKVLSVRRKFLRSATAARPSGDASERFEVVSSS